MSDLFDAREITKVDNKIPEFYLGSPPGAVKPTILSVGDPIPDADLLDACLEQKGIACRSGDVQSRTERQPAKSPDLVVLNFKRLTFEAHNTIRKAKERHRVPVVCLVPVEDADKLALIESLGADEYLFKPFNMQEFVCRMNLLLRRHRKHRTPPAIERRAHFRRQTDQKRSQQIQDPGHSEVQIDDEKKLVRLGDRTIALTPKEYRLFCLLASEAGRVFSADEIIDNLWKGRQRASTNDVQQYIYLLRKKVEPDIRRPRWVETVKGFGYRLNVANA